MHVGTFFKETIPVSFPKVQFHCSGQTRTLQHDQSLIFKETQHNMNMLCKPYLGTLYTIRLYLLTLIYSLTYMNLQCSFSPILRLRFPVQLYCKVFIVLTFIINIVNNIVQFRCRYCIWYGINGNYCKSWTRKYDTQIEIMCGKLISHLSV